jgi:FkbM family methyltransferase
VLFDVGANIGLYSVYAARRGVSVLAFEPEARNVAELNRNIRLNNVESLVMSVPVALSDRYGPSVLYGNGFEAGNALNTVGEPLDWKGEPYLAAAQQGVMCFPLDRFLQDFPTPFPNHVKIDVDGSEHRVIAGALSTLSDPRLRSVLIELNEDLSIDRELVGVIENAGLKYAGKQLSPLVPDGGLHSKSLNYQFARSLHASF